MFGEVYKDKRVLVTGNTGFKGSWLSMWLLKLGAEVYGCSDDMPSNPSMFKVLGLEKKVKHTWLDVRDKEKVHRLIKEIKPDFVFHLAAQALVAKSYQDPVDTFTTNVNGTANVLEGIRLSGISCVAVMITSDKCYDNVEWPWGYKETDALGGKDVYSASKGAAELVIKSYYYSFFKNSEKVALASARAGNVIGGGDWAEDRIIPDCVRAWSTSEKVEIRSPKATRPWQFVLEPLSGYLKLGQSLSESRKMDGESFNFGPLSQYNHTVAELIGDLGIMWGFESAEDAFIITGNVPFHEAGLLKLNCDKSLLFLKWMPTLDYKKLIEFTGSWYKSFYHKQADMFVVTLSQIEDYEQIAAKKRLEWTL